MRFIVDRNNGDGTATIGMVGDSEGDPFVDLMLTVSDADAERFRDALIEMYPVDDPAGQNDWRGDDEWVEVSLSEARPGDMAEFVRDGNEKTYRGTLSREGNYLVIRPEDFDGPSIGFSWIIRCGDGDDGGKMTDLHIWRKLDPKRFDEPSEVGVYATQSGMMLYNDGNAPNWLLVEGRKWDDTPYVYWDDVRKHLDDSEFPLTHVTEGMVRGMVGGDAE